MPFQQVASPRGKSYPRILGSYETARAGPTFLVTGGLHGNEPAGAEAALRVCERLLRDEPPLCGRFLAIACNLGALAENERYLDEDLNRLWQPQAVRALRAQPPELDSREEGEQREILQVFDDCASAGGELIVVDLHTSSANGAPFTCMADTIRNRRIAFALPLPVILGLEETIDGAMLDYAYACGHLAVAVEGGRHDREETVNNLEAAVWLALVAAGCLAREDVPDHAAHRCRLERVSRGIPRVVEVRYREVLEEDDAFEMQPGYRSFAPVQQDELLAHKNGKELRAGEKGLILLPLYTKKGSDGFFLGRPVRPFWLVLSHWLRRIRFARVLPLLPGVRRHPRIPDAFLVDPTVALWKSVDIFHLLGFRRERKEGDKLVFTRRRG